MKKTKTTTSKAAVEKPPLQRRKRAATIGLFPKPDEPNWSLSDKDWKKIEDECNLELDEDVRGAIREIILDYFYQRDIELTQVRLDESQAFLAKVGNAAATLNMLLAAHPASPAITAMRDVLRDTLFDPLSPLFQPESYLERSFRIRDDGVVVEDLFKTDQSYEEALKAIEQHDPVDDIVPHLGRLIKGVDEAMIRNAECAAKKVAKGKKEKPPKLSDWDVMVCEIAHVLEGAGLRAVVSSNARFESSFVALMLALTDSWPEQYRQHHSGYKGQSPTAMAAAILEARSANKKRCDAIAAAKARKSSGDLKNARA